MKTNGVLLLMMGGSGTRFGASRPKQYIEIDGIPLFVHILQPYFQNGVADRAVIVCHRDWIDYAIDVCGKLGYGDKVTVVPGGDTRSESILNGWKKLCEDTCSEDVIMIHDATHPLVDVKGAVLARDKAYECGAATLGSRIWDSTYLVGGDEKLGSSISRSSLIVGASPECFRLDILSSLIGKSTMEDLQSATSIGALALKKGVPVHYIETDVLNLKITFKTDLELFKIIWHGQHRES